IIAEELFSKSETGHNLDAFVKDVRQGINSAANSAVESDEDHYVRHPQRLFRTKRFFEDIKLIQKLIERNQNTDRADLLRTTRRGLPDPPDLLRLPARSRPWKEIDDLIASLSRTAESIAPFLRRFKPQGKPGKHDPFTRVFIDEVFDLWRELYWAEESPDEN